MFRLDINGLRFLAVTSVLLFHFHIPFFSGGYAGVDVFFVISGYLMHSILSKDKINIESIFLFYKKRLIRIYPALSICLFLFSIIYSLIYLPSSVSKLFWQILSASTFTSNIYFTKALSNYFSETAESYIFLHTWSLSVEFQYYLIFPLFMYLIRKIRANEQSLILISAIASFLLCLIIVNYKPKIAFFNLPFRAWELLIGAYISSINGKIKINIKTKKIIELLCISGLLLYITTGGQSGDWPNIKSTIPVTLTAIILLLSIDNKNVLLKGKVFQLIGLCSYSIYLYHWPIASLIITNGLIDNVLAKVIGIITSIILGVISYKVIESKKNLTYSSPSFQIIPILSSLIIPVIIMCSGLSKTW